MLLFPKYKHPKHQDISIITPSRVIIEIKQPLSIFFCKKKKDNE